MNGVLAEPLLGDKDNVGDAHDNHEVDLEGGGRGKQEEPGSGRGVEEAREGGEGEGVSERDQTTRLIIKNETLIQRQFSQNRL